MSTPLMWLVATAISIFVGIVFYRVLVIYSPVTGIDEKLRKAALGWRIYQVWNHTICFFVGGVGVFLYFIKVRSKQISMNGNLSLSDFVLVLMFLVSVMGLLPYLLTNLTKGIAELLKKGTN